MTTTLREVTRTDLPAITAWRRDRALIAHLGAPFRFINRETDEAWFDDYLKHRGSQVRCVICVDETPIGLVSLTQIDPVHRHAELHILIGSEEHRGRGCGTCAMRLMLCHSFHDLNLHRVYLHVVAANSRADAFYERLGFVLEGMLRDAVYKQGRFQDVAVLGVLATEFVSSLDSRGSARSGSRYQVRAVRPGGHQAGRLQGDHRSALGCLSGALGGTVTGGDSRGRLHRRLLAAESACTAGATGTGT